MTIYLILNTLDSIFLPLSFAIKHNFFVYFCCCCRSKIISNNNNENEASIQEIEVDGLLPQNKKN